MDGFLRAGSNDVYSIGYYVEEDLSFFSALARNYTVLDRCFCSILASTFPNRLFLHSANTDRLGNSVDLTSLPTIWDRLAESGVSGTYYFLERPDSGILGIEVPWDFRSLRAVPHRRVSRDAALCLLR